MWLKIPPGVDFELILVNYLSRARYLCFVFEQPEEPQFTPEDILGVDLGIVKLASTSDGARK
jgi:transposase